MEPLNSKDPKSIGGFTLVGRLGKGGMGVVYLASRKSESVALKVIRDSLIDDESEATRFSREVATLEQISSANVARIVDAGVEDGRAWFAAEFVNGPNLSELVNDKGPLDRGEGGCLPHPLATQAQQNARRESLVLRSRGRCVSRESLHATPERNPVGH